MRSRSRSSKEQAMFRTIRYELGEQMWKVRDYEAESVHLMATVPVS